MASKPRKVMLINVTHSEESRVAILHDGVLEAFEIETFDHRSLKGNIYKARVESVQPGLQAAFVDIGQRRGAFLPLDEVNFAVHPVRGDAAKGRIENHLQKGQELLVQVVRDAFSNKPPTVSTYFSLPGRYLVLTPYQPSVGISRKLEDKQRERLRAAIDGVERPEAHGVIVRTAGAAATKVDLQRDLRYLTRLWERIEEAGRRVRAPKLVYQERSLVIRAVRDLMTPDIDELLVDNRETYEEILEFFETVAPHRKRIVKLYEGSRPIFNKHNLEEQIENIFRRRVPLPSGGAIVFDVTEALTAVDVNSGKMRKEGHIEDTALKANLEAAEEIARQLRLRDLGGLVVIDFIDMRSSKAIRQVEKAMREALKKDRARYDVTRISSLGLMEISRERLAAEKSSLRYTDCPACAGTGKIKTIEAAAMQALRRLQTRVVRGDVEEFVLRVPPEVAEYLLNNKRDELVQWEERYRTRIVVRGMPEYGRDDLTLDTVVRERSRDSEPVVVPPSHVEILAQHEEDEAAAAEAEAQAEAEPSENGAKKKRRRRRRRRKRNGEAGETGEAADAGLAAEGGDGQDAAGAEDAAAAAEGEPAGAEAESEGEGRRKKRRRRRRRKKRNGEAAEAEDDGGTEADGEAPAAADGADEPVPAEEPGEPLELPDPEPVLADGAPAPRPLWWRLLRP
ncbi:MAG: hypothetical protein Kow0062_26800 [Acidobacteriota bacterium]